MIDRSLRWKPLRAYSYFALLFAGGLTLGVVGVFLFRNPATGIWAVFAAPLYLLAFLSVAEVIVFAVLTVELALKRANRLSRVLAAAIVAGFGGLAIGLVFWWCIEFVLPPVWAGVIAAAGSAVAFGGYTWRYESLPRDQ